MRLKSLVVAAISAICVFTYFSLPLLRELYGDSVLIAVYAGLGLLSGSVVYIMLERILQVELSSEDTTDESKEILDNAEDEKEKRENRAQEELESLEED